MRYLIRAVKYMVYFAIVFIIIVCIVYMFSTQKLAGMSLLDLFKEGSLFKILLLFIGFSLIYPALSFQKKEILVDGPFTKYAEMVDGVMKGLNYKKETEQEGKVTYRCAGGYARFSRMFEDRITFDTTASPFTVEGYRKDLLRILSALNYRIRQERGDDAQ